MNNTILDTKRAWNWKVFLVLAGLIVPAEFAILPFQFSRQKAFGGSDAMVGIGWETLLIDLLINILILILLGGLGLLLANRIGLGMPFVEGWIKRGPLPGPFRHVVAIAWITAVVLVLSSLLLRTLLFDPPLNVMYKELGIAIPEGASAPPLYGLLAGLSAGITEETLYRLFGLSLLAWLGGLLFHGPNGRPRPAVFWGANLIFSLAFGAAHLPTAAGLGLPINVLTVTSTLVLNALGGLAFGWLFWTFGLESAMLAHFFADFIMYALIPLITMQNLQSARYVATAGVVAAMLLALGWACRCLLAERGTRPVPAAQ